MESKSNDIADAKSPLKTGETGTTASTNFTTETEYFSTDRKLNTLTLPIRKRSISQSENNTATLSHTRSASFPSPGKNQSWKKEINKLIKEQGIEKGLKLFVERLTISKPYNFSHTVNVKFNPLNLSFEGLPRDWENSFECHFGSAIPQCPRIKVEGYNERIPAVLELLKANLVKNEGLKSEGIFRVAADKLQVLNFKKYLKSSNFKKIENDQNLDPYISANLIKQYFRELTPNCLLDCFTKQQVIALGSGEMTVEQGFEIIPEPNKSVLLWLLDLLSEVVKYKEYNRMTVKNLAIVLSPNLFTVDNLTPMEALVFSQKAAALVTKFLESHSQMQSN